MTISTFKRLTKLSMLVLRVGFTGLLTSHPSTNARSAAAYLNTSRATLRIQIGQTVGSLTIPINARAAQANEYSLIGLRQCRATFGQSRKVDCPQQSPRAVVSTPYQGSALSNGAARRRVTAWGKLTAILTQMDECGLTKSSKVRGEPGRKGF
jgi:hypothetical protein